MLVPQLGRLLEVFESFGIFAVVSKDDAKNMNRGREVFRGGLLKKRIGALRVSSATFPHFKLSSKPILRPRIALSSLTLKRNDSLGSAGVFNRCCISHRGEKKCKSKKWIAFFHDGQRRDDRRCAVLSRSVQRPEGAGATAGLAGDFSISIGNLFQVGSHPKGRVRLEVEGMGLRRMFEFVQRPLAHHKQKELRKMIQSNGMKYSLLFAYSYC